MYNNNYKKLEESISSNPETIYVDKYNEFDEPNKITYIKPHSDTEIFIKYNVVKKNNFVHIVDDYIDKIPELDDNGLDNNEPDNNEPDNNEPDNNEPDNNKPDNNELDNNELDNNESDNNEPDNNEPTNNQQENEYNNIDTIFDCYNEENSVNNAIGCCGNENHGFIVTDDNIEVASSYIFDKDPLFIEVDEPCPFDKYDKVKQKNHKNIERLGMVTFSAMIMLGSAYITKYMN